MLNALRELPLFETWSCEKYCSQNLAFFKSVKGRTILMFLQGLGGGVHRDQLFQQPNIFQHSESML